MSSLLKTSRKGFYPLIIVDVKFARNIEIHTKNIKNGIRPFDECKMWMSSLPATLRIGLHPLISVDVKSIRNIKNGFTPFNMLKISICRKNVFQI